MKRKKVLKEVPKKVILQKSTEESTKKYIQKSAQVKKDKKEHSINCSNKLIYFNLKKNSKKCIYSKLNFKSSIK